MNLPVIYSDGCSTILTPPIMSHFTSKVTFAVSMFDS